MIRAKLRILRQRLRCRLTAVARSQASGFSTRGEPRARGVRPDEGLLDQVLRLAGVAHDGVHLDDEPAVGPGEHLCHVDPVSTAVRVGAAIVALVADMTVSGYVEVAGRREAPGRPVGDGSVALNNSAPTPASRNYGEPQDEEATVTAHPGVDPGNGAVRGHS